ncbi:hypothetical protein PAXRUDRAFT_832282, partial [Paxillus rubicundulus Ve08.2h10]
MTRVPSNNVASNPASPDMVSNAILDTPYLMHSIMDPACGSGASECHTYLEVGFLDAV